MAISSCESTGMSPAFFAPKLASDAPYFMKYGASEASFGAKNAGDIPVDSHELIAMCAPRLTFVSYGVPEKGDAKWLDHQGSFMAAIAAQPVFRLLGVKD